MRFPGNAEGVQRKLDTTDFVRSSEKPSLLKFIRDVEVHLIEQIGRPSVLLTVSLIKKPVKHWIKTHVTFLEGRTSGVGPPSVSPF